MADEFIDPSRIEAAKEIAVAEDGPRRRLSGVQGLVASSLAVAMSLLFHVLGMGLGYHSDSPLPFHSC